LESLDLFEDLRPIFERTNFYGRRGIPHPWLLWQGALLMGVSLQCL